MQCANLCYCLLPKPVNLVALLLRNLASALQVLNLGKEKKYFPSPWPSLAKRAQEKFAKLDAFFYPVKLASLQLQYLPHYNSHMRRNTLVGNYQHGPTDV